MIVQTLGREHHPIINRNIEEQVTPNNQKEKRIVKMRNQMFIPGKDLPLSTG